MSDTPDALERLRKVKENAQYVLSSCSGNEYMDALARGQIILAALLEPMLAERQASPEPETGIVHGKHFVERGSIKGQWKDPPPGVGSVGVVFEDGTSLPLDELKPAPSGVPSPSHPAIELWERLGIKADASFKKACILTIDAALCSAAGKAVAAERAAVVKWLGKIFPDSKFPPRIAAGEHLKRPAPPERTTQRDAVEDSF